MEQKNLHLMYRDLGVLVISMTLCVYSESAYDLSSQLRVVKLKDMPNNG